MIKYIIEPVVTFIIYLIIIGSLFTTEEVDNFNDIIFIILIFAGICIASFGYDAMLYLIIFRIGMMILNLLISLLVFTINFFKKTIDKDK